MNKYSHGLSQTLRHTAFDEGIALSEMSDDGYVDVNILFKLKKFKGCDEKLVREIVAKDKKTRFSLKESDGHLYICANQGHSGKVAEHLDSEKYLTLLTEPVVPCIHGTYSDFLDSIKTKGLMRMSRKHIHCAAGLPNEVKSGMRADCNVFIYVDMKAAMQDGIKFYKSKNDVILTEGINGVLDPKYFSIKLKKQK